MRWRDGRWGNGQSSGDGNAGDGTRAVSCAADLLPGQRLSAGSQPPAYAYMAGRPPPSPDPDPGPFPIATLAPAS